MLVLSRKPGESIIIGDQIVVTIAEIRGGKVRLAIKAPLSVAVDRTELREKILTTINQGSNGTLRAVPKIPGNIPIAHSVTPLQAV